MLRGPNLYILIVVIHLLSLGIVFSSANGADSCEKLVKDFLLSRDEKVFSQNAKVFQSELQNISRVNKEAKGLNFNISILEDAHQEGDATGDFYRAQRLEDGRLSLLLGDVTSHGPIAAAHSLKAQLAFDDPTFAKRIYAGFPSTSELLERFDRYHEINYKETYLMAITHVTFDKEKMMIEISGAGNPPVLIVKNDLSIKRIRTQGGRVVGLNPDIIPFEIRGPFEIVSVPLEKGDIVVLMTDGITDVMRKDGSEELVSKGKWDYLEDSLLRRMRENENEPNKGQNLVNAIRDEMGEVTDDFVLIAIEI